MTYSYLPPQRISELTSVQQINDNNLFVLVDSLNSSTKSVSFFTLKNEILNLVTAPTSSKLTISNTPPADKNNGDVWGVPTTREFNYWDGNFWQPLVKDYIKHNLENAKNVDISTYLNGAPLVWDELSNKWKFSSSLPLLKETYDSNNNGIVDNSEKLDNNLPSYYLNRLNHVGKLPLTELATNSVTLNQLIRYNGTQWVASDIQLNDLIDVDINPNPVEADTGKALIWDGTKYILGTPFFESSSASNLGTGFQVFESKQGIDFKFRTIKAGSGISLNLINSNTEIEIVRNVLSSTDIPNIDANKVTTGTFNLARIPTIPNTQTSGFGTSATRNIPASGNANTTEVVLGTDTRLTDARTPIAHNQDASTITTGVFSLSRLPTIPNTQISGLGTASTLNFAVTGNASINEVVLGSDTRLIDSRAPSGLAGGDLLGSNYPNPVIANKAITYNKIQDVQGSSFLVRFSTTLGQIQEGSFGNGLSLNNTTGLLTVNDSQLNHNLLTNYVVNQHIDHSLVSITAGTGLTGGGNLTTTRSLSLTNTGIATGTYTKLTIDAQGRAIAGTTLDVTDIPNLDTAKLTSGTLAIARIPTIPNTQISGLGTSSTLNFPTTGDAISTEVVIGTDTRLTNARTPLAHNHAASDVNSGTFALAQIPTIPNTQISGLGTASTRNVPATGNAATTEVVLGTDTRLTNARTPVAHNQDASTITTGILALARIPTIPNTQTSGFGTSALLNVPVTLGSNATNTEVVRGDDPRLTNSRTPITHTHAAEDITSGTLVLARIPTIPNTQITGLGTSSTRNVPTSGNATSTEVVLGTDTRLTDARTPTAHNQDASTITTGILNSARLPTASTTAQGAIQLEITADTTKFLSGAGTWLTLSIPTNTSQLTNDSGFVINTLNLIAGNGLTGGGTLSVNRTFTLGTPSSITTSSTNSVTGTTHTHEITGFVPNTRTVTAGTGLTGGGDFSADITLSLANTAVTPGTYPKVTVDQQGRITAGTTLITADIPNLDTSKLTTGILPIARGGTGSTTQNFVDLTTAQTVAGIKSFSAGTFQLTNATSNFFIFGAGSAIPSFTTRSVGTKITLFNSLAAAAVDYALGIEPSNMWFSVANASAGYKWYAGTTNIASLSGDGELTLNTPLALTSGGTGAETAAEARTNLGLGTASTRNIPASGNAATTEVVLGTDTRLTDARTPIVHNQDASTITTGTLALARIPTIPNTQTSGFGTSALLNVPVTVATNASSTEVVRGDDPRLTNSRNPTGAAGGDLTGTYPNPTVANNSITYAKIQDISTTTRLIGRYSAGAGNPQECIVGSGLILDSVSGELYVDPGAIGIHFLNGYNANEHIDHSSISILAGVGLTGGGDLLANRTITLGTPSTLTAATTNSVTGTTHTHAITGFTPTTRTLTAGVGMTGGGDLSANRTITLGTPSTLTAATTNSVTGTTHTHAITGFVPITRLISNGTGITGGGDLTVDRTLSLTNTGITAGTYTKLTVDAQGRATVGTTLVDADVPNLDTSKITTGILQIARGGTGSTTKNFVDLTTDQTIDGIKSFSSGTINLTDTTKNQIIWSLNGTGAPTTTTRSNGTKLVLYPSLNASATDYALGIESNNMWFSVPSSGAGYKFYANTTQIARLAGNGDLEITGSFIADGVKLNNSISVADTQVLDYYNELQTFTPSLVGATTAGVFTYSSQQGRYTRVGNVVYFTIVLNITGTTTAPVGILRINNLPFTSANIAGNVSSVHMGYFTNLTTPDLIVTGLISSNSTFITLYKNMDLGLTPSDISTTMLIYASGFYFV